MNCDALDSGVRIRQFITESEVHKDLREALPKTLTLDENDDVPILSPNTVTKTDPVDGTFVLSRLEALGPSNDILADMKPACCRALTSMLSDAPEPEVTLTEAAESLVQHVANIDEDDDLERTLLSTLTKLEPRTATVKLPLEGEPDPTVITASAGMLNEIADANSELDNAPTDAIMETERPEPCDKRAYSDESDIHIVAEQCVVKRQLGEKSRDENDRPTAETTNCPVVGPTAELVKRVTLE